MQVVTSGHDSILWPKTSFQKLLSSFPLITFFLHTFENWSFLTISSYTDTYFRSLYFYLSFCFPALSSLHAALGPCVHMYSNYFVVLSKQVTSLEVVNMNKMRKSERVCKQLVVKFKKKCCYNLKLLFYLNFQGRYTPSPSGKGFWGLAKTFVCLFVWVFSWQGFG